jgi:hypothetical protein
LGFVLVCADDDSFNAKADSSIECSINLCNGTMTGGVPGADYSACALSETGEMCTPKCPEGTASNGESSVSFALICDDLGNFDAPVGELPGMECVVNSCNGFVYNARPYADYSWCVSDTTTGGVCKPVCLDGYTTTGASKGFTMSCNAQGNFNALGDDGDLVCSPNLCNGTVHRGVENADYSSCSGSRTGDTCIPDCPEGYTTGGSSEGFTLECHENGNFNALLEVGNLECTVNRCTQALNGARNADYSACEVLTTTLGTCKPECPVGFTAQGASNGITLECNSIGEFDTTGDTGNLTCVRNSCDGTMRGGIINADYTECADMDTGDICSPDCPSGYKSSGESKGVELICDGSGAYDASGDTGTLVCEPNKCDGEVVNGVWRDVSSCGSMSTGDLCVPRCLQGFGHSGGTATGFPMVCNDDSGFDAKWNSGGLECERIPRDQFVTPTISPPAAGSVAAGNVTIDDNSNPSSPPQCVQMRGHRARASSCMPPGDPTCYGEPDQKGCAVFTAEDCQSSIGPYLAIGCPAMCNSCDLF